MISAEFNALITSTNHVSHIEPTSNSLITFQSTPNSWRSRHSSRTIIADKMVLLKRMSSGISKSFSGKKSNEDSCFSGSSNSEIFVSSHAQDRDKHEASTSRLFSLRRHRKHSDDYPRKQLDDCLNQYTISTQMTGFNPYGLTAFTGDESHQLSVHSADTNFPIDKQNEGVNSNDRINQQNSGGPILVPQTVELKLRRKSSCYHSDKVYRSISPFHRSHCSSSSERFKNYSRKDQHRRNIRDKSKKINLEELTLLHPLPTSRRISSHSLTLESCTHRHRISNTSHPKERSPHHHHRRHHSHDRVFSTESGYSSHQPSRRVSVLQGSPEKAQEQLRQLQQSSQPSHTKTSRHRRWSLSNRDGECDVDRGFETIRGLGRFTRRSSIVTSSPSPIYRRFSPFLGWFVPFRGFGRATNANMGAALGNCCAGRDDETVKQKAKDKMDKTWDFLQGEQILSDVDKFDKAYAANDIKGFVDLLNSAEPIEELPEKMHPWAADPKTVGALATTQLAILAAKEDDLTIKDRIRDSGAIPILVKNLNSKEEDRLHASVVALSFLSVDSPRNSIEIFESGAIPMLIKGIESNIEGLRGATAQTCRNIYVLDLKYRAEFKKHGGIQSLVKLLDLPHGEVDPENLFNQLEAVYHLEDLILETGEELPEYVSEVKKAGAVRRLEALSKIENQDLSEAAQYLLVRLAD